MGNNKKFNKDAKGYKKGGKRYGSPNKGANSERFSKEEGVSEVKKSSDHSGMYDKITTNDISWWNKSPMYADATRVPFNRIYGAPVSGENYEIPSIGNDPPTNVVINDFNIPGVMAIDFAPMIGSTRDGSSSPVNRCFTSLYGDIYSKTTGAMQFQQADLAMLMTGMSSIACAIADVKRVLGVSTLYSGANYYYPRALIHACGYDPSKVIGHQDELRMRLNDIILSFNGLKIPDFMDIYKRQYALSHNVYADEDDQQAQLYVFRSEFMYKYIDIGASGGKLQIQEFNRTDADPNEIIDLIDECLQAWRNSSDLGLISGSIQRAFSEANLIVLDYVNVGDQIQPLVDRNILWQINNSVSMADLDLNSCEIYQDPVRNCIMCNPRVSMRAGTIGNDSPLLYRNRWVLNSFDSVIDDEFVMEATRLMPIPGLVQYEVSSNWFEVQHWNTEIVTGYHIYYTYRNNNVPSEIKVDSMRLTSFLNLNVNWGDPRAKVLMAMWTKFKNAPRLYLVDYDSSIYDIYEEYGYIGDVYRFTTVDRESLVGLNHTALQSIYQTNVLTR